MPRREEKKLRSFVRQTSVTRKLLFFNLPHVHSI